MATPKTKAQYEEQGRDDAARGMRSPALTGSSWQAVAYSKGWKVGRVQRAAGYNKTPAQARHKPSAFRGKLPEFLEAKRRAHFAHWPQAASEHLMRLSHDAAQETDLKRIERLLRAIGRLGKKYGPPKTNDEVFQMLGQNFEHLVQRKRDDMQQFGDSNHHAEDAAEFLGQGA